MKKWSTDWTPINVVSHVQHKAIAGQASPLQLNAVGNSVVATQNIAQDGDFSGFIKPPPEPEIIIQGHTDEELAAAKKQAYEEGFNKAKQASDSQINTLQTQVDAGVATAFNDLATKIQPLVQQWQDYNKKVPLETRELAYTIARKVATEALKEDAVKNIEQLVEQCLEHIMREPKVTITIHSSHESDFRNYMNKHPVLSGLSKQVVVETNNDLAPTDCEIKWHQGGANLSIKERWKHIESLLGIELKRPAEQITGEEPEATRAPEPQNPAEGEKVDVQADSETV